MSSAILAGWGQACHRQYWLGRLGMSSAILAGQARHIIGNTGWVGSGMTSAILAGWGQACHRQYWLGGVRHVIGNTGWAGSACHQQYWLGRLGMPSAILAGQARHVISNTGWMGSGVVLWGMARGRGGKGEARCQVVKNLVYVI